MKVSDLLKDLMKLSVGLESKHIQRLVSAIRQEIELAESSGRITYNCLIGKLHSELLSIALLVYTETEDTELLKRSLGLVLTQLYTKLKHQRNLNEKGVLYKYEWGIQSKVRSRIKTES